MSKQTINKAERFEIISGLVVEATKKTGNALMKQITQIFKETEQALLDNWLQHVPEVSRGRVPDLLQAHVLNAADLRNMIVYCDTDRKSSQTLFYMSWRSDKLPDTRKELQTTLMRRSANSWAGDCLSLSSGAWNNELTIKTKFHAVPTGFSSGCIVHPEDPGPSLNMHLNDFLYGVHFSSRTLLNEVQELLDSAWSMYETLEAQLAPVKTVDALLKLIPEASKHLPNSLKQPKAAKELADPSAINEIRAKLAAGLPI